MPTEAGESGRWWQGRSHRRRRGGDRRADYRATLNCCWRRPQPARQAHGGAHTFCARRPCRRHEHCCQSANKEKRNIALCGAFQIGPATAMASGEVAGIGALLKPNKYSILKFVDLHPGGAAALSGQVILPRRFFFFLLLRMSQDGTPARCCCATGDWQFRMRGCSRFYCWARLLRVCVRRRDPPRSSVDLARVDAALDRSHVSRCTRMIDWWRWTVWLCVA